jgi:hypothetical protein
MHPMRSTGKGLSGDPSDFDPAVFDLASVDDRLHGPV